VGWDDQEDSPPTRRTYSDAEAAADLATYKQLKGSVLILTGALTVVGALALERWSPAGSLAILIGGLCGIGNMLLSTRGNERLVETRKVRAFVISSFLRLGLLGIVAAVLALRGPAWSLGPFFLGFFLPLALFAARAPRAFERK